MQKRRPHQNAGLPMTTNDLSAKDSSARRTSSIPAQAHRKRKNGKSKELFEISAWLVLLVVGLLIGVILCLTRNTRSRRSEELDVGFDLPCSQYTSLRYAFRHSKLVGLYFAAAWCPMSTPVTETIDEVLGAELLPPLSATQNPPTERMEMSIVYISSDRTEEAFQDYHRRNWMSVPFQSDERTALKKHFSVCAGPEVDILGINRKFEIPTLIILDGESHGIITTNGAEDLMEYKEKTLEHWMDLYHLVRAMEDKYGVEDSNMLNRTPDHRIHHAESISSLFA